MKYHIIAFFAGFLLDLVFGDPHFLPHPIRLIGKLITETERMLRGADAQTDEGETNSNKADKNSADINKKEFRQGVALTLIIIVCVVTVVSFILFMAYIIHPYLGLAAECVMTYQILAVKCLKVESMKVYKCLKDNDIEQARKAVSMIVGRDTECLDDEGVTKAAVETVAENTSDGVIAPMLYLAVGGPVLGFLYKAINTMDSMIGYKNDRYLYFGKAAAKLDDLANFIPSRISAYLMIAAAFLAGRDFSAKGAYEIYKRDRRKHASPNSGQTEAVCAGALSIRLAGDASYFGKMVKKPYIGDMVRKAEYEDIRRVNRLMYITAWLCEGICVLVMLILW
ncbi:MAG: adenosylcobinamide-phosphate synthase CbiB [Butyrivibrio sp.]|nr:adenosylcobinamide-phosphate synthase CbiB [Butyrivibrio sp.]